MLGSSLVLIFGLILLWRRRVPAYINAFTGQSIALAGVAGGQGILGNNPDPSGGPPFRLVFKGRGFPGPRPRMGRAFGAGGGRAPTENRRPRPPLPGRLVLL